MDAIVVEPPLQSVVRERFDTLFREMVASAGAAQTRLLDSLNSSFRRLRETATIEDVAALALEMAAPFATRVGFFLFRDGVAQAQHARNLGDLPVPLDLDAAAAFRAVIESKDPVVAVGTPSEIGAELSQRIGFESSERVHLFPLAVRNEVRGISFAAGEVQLAALELISAMAASRMELLLPPPPPKREDLVSIAGSPKPAPATKGDWAQLTLEEQALHLKAQRFARLRTAEMRIEHGDAFRRGTESGNLYAALREPIDRAREEFRRDFANGSSSMVDYLYLEMVRGLADNDDRRLGSGFPGPLVTAK